MKVLISAGVRNFLASEKTYLRKHSTTASRRLSAQLRGARHLLAEFPMAGSEKLPVKGVRRLVMGDYCLDYEICGNAVHVLSMRHGRQHDPDLEFDESDFGNGN